MLPTIVAVQTACLFALQNIQKRHLRAVREPRHIGRVEGDRGQTTAEYALVLLGAAGIAVLLAAWAAKSGKIGRLLDIVLDQVIDRAK